jgi:hypothetical protein
LPTLVDGGKTFYGSSAVIKYLLSSDSSITAENALIFDDLLHYEQLTFQGLVQHCSEDATNAGKFIRKTLLNVF